MLMKIEILYSDVCNLYADLENIYYLKKVYDNVEIYETKLNDVPRFTYSDVDLVYMGSCSYMKSSIVIDKLKIYKEDIIKYIDSNKLFLVTGSSSELFGKSIISDDDSFEGLGIFDYVSVRSEVRKNFLFLGEFNDIKIVGNKSQFFFLDNVDSNFIKVIKGYGNNKEDKYEGVVYKNFYMTSLLGPFLILNPYFCEYLFGKGNFDKSAFDAYDLRVSGLMEEDARIFMGDHG